METQEMASSGGEGTDGLAQVLEGLAPNEMLAMTSLMRGDTMTAAAKAAGVSRETLYQWLKPGKALHRSMQIWKKDFSETARTRLLMLTGVATANVARALKDGDVKVSVTLLHRLGILSPPAVGPANVEAVAEVGRLKKRAARRSEKTVRKALSFTEQWTQFTEETGDKQAGVVEGDDGGSGADEGGEDE